jgi:hypothetical protein
MRLTSAQLSTCPSDACLIPYPGRPHRDAQARFCFSVVFVSQHCIPSHVRPVWSDRDEQKEQRQETSQMSSCPAQEAHACSEASPQGGAHIAAFPQRTLDRAARARRLGCTPVGNGRRQAWVFRGIDEGRDQQGGQASHSQCYDWARPRQVGYAEPSRLTYTHKPTCTCTYVYSYMHTHTHIYTHSDADKWHFLTFP